MVLHRLIARRVVGKDIADIDAINDNIIDAQLKFPWLVRLLDLLFKGVGSRLCQ